MLRFLALNLALLAQAPRDGNMSSWKTYTSKAGEFSVRMPGKPVEKTIKVPESPRVIAVLSYKSGDTVLTAMRIPLLTPVSKTEADDYFVDLKEMGAKGKVLGERRLEVNGSPALELTTETGGNSGPQLSHSRYILEGDSTYQVSIISLSGQIPKGAERFFDSLKIAAWAAVLQWKAVAPADAGFSVMMPGALQNKPVSPEDVVLGHKPDYLVCAPVGSGTVGVLHLGLTESDLRGGTEQTLIRVRDDDANRAKKVKRTLGRDRRLIVAGHPAREYQIESDMAGGTLMRIRSILVGARLYRLVVLGSKADFPTEAAKRFFSSFKLTGERARSSPGPEDATKGLAPSRDTPSEPIRP